MNLSDVLVKITWPTSTGPSISPIDENNVLRISIKDWITELYRSPKAAQILNAAAAAGNLNFFESSDGSKQGTLANGKSFMAIDTTEIAKLYYFNDKGVLILEKPEVTLIHEIIHTTGPSDPLPPGQSPTNAQMSAAFDFDGETVRIQNEISRELGYINNIQMNYYSSILSDSGLFKYFNHGISYSEGRMVDTPVIPQNGGGGNDTLDLTSSYKVNSVDILFGLAGDDNLNGGKGSDYLYGGEGADKFIASDGSDLFHGGGTQNSDGTASIINDDGIDTVDYSMSDATQFIKITTDITIDNFHSGAIDASNRILVSQTGEMKGVATLISIENIKGTIGVDTFEVTQLISTQIGGTDGKGGLVEIDLAGNDKPGLEGDLIDATKMNNSLTIDLAALSGFIQIKDDNESRVRVLNAERAWGGYKDDKITGNNEANELKGGKGDDELFGGDGDDALLGGDGDDRLWGDAGSDQLNGGAGFDTVYYAVNGKPITIEYDGSAISVKDGGGSNDTLNSIESIIGTSSRDILKIIGSIATETNLIIDANGGQSPNPSDSINASKAIGAISISIDNQGIGFVKSIATNGKIDLVGFHTGIIGSASDDSIIDLSSGDKRIDAGSGNDTVTIGAGSALVDGGAGDDHLQGGSGNDVLVGGSGQNFLNGGLGNDKLISASVGDRLDGGDGHDYLQGIGALDTTIVGGLGNDVVDFTKSIERGRDQSAGTIVYEFRAGDGHDVIVGQETLGNAAGEYEGGIALPYYDGLLFSEYGIDAIIFRGLQSSDVEFVFDIKESIKSDTEFSYDSYYYTISADLAIVVKSTGESIYLGRVAAHAIGQNIDSIWRIDDISLPNIIFEDGWIQYEGDFGLLKMRPTVGDVLQYLPTEDFFTTFAGGVGDVNGTDEDDQLTGDSGDQSVSGGGGQDNYEASGGQDTFDGGAGNDTLSIFDSAVNFDFERQESGSVLVTSRSGLEGVVNIINVEDVYSVSDDSSYAIASLAGDYGTVGDDPSIQGTARGDSLFGLAGNDILHGGLGDDRLDGGSGTDIALYDGSSTSFRVYRDMDGSIAVADLTGGEGRDRLVGIETIRFVDEDLDVSLIPALGTTGNDTLLGDGRANVLFGLDGDDVIDGREGADILNGGLGSDTYVVHANEGEDTIIDTASPSGNDVDILDATSISTGAVTVARDWSEERSGDLLVSLGSNSAIIRVTGQFADWLDQGIESLRLAGSVIYNREALVNMAVAIGTAGDDQMFGAVVGGRIDAGLGADTIFSRGVDTFIYREGDGNDLIVDCGPYQDGDTLWLADMTAADVSFIRSGHDLVMTTVSNGQSLTVQGQFDVQPSESGYYYGDGGVEYIKFSNGYIIEVSSIAETLDSVPTIGTSGDDIIIGTIYDDIIEGGNGEDIIFGINGNDTINGGSGDDEIHGEDGADNIDGGDGIDTVVFSGDYRGYNFSTEPDGSISVSAYGTNLGTIINIEKLHFDFHDVTLSAIDFSFIGNPAPYLYNSLQSQGFYRGSAIDIEIPANAFQDPNDPILSYSAALYDGSSLPSWLSMSGSHLVGVASTTAYGPIQIKITASDGDNSVSDSFTLWVAPFTETEYFADSNFTGTNNNDLISASAQNPIIIDGGSGDDMIIINSDNVTSFGGDGNDVIIVQGADATLIGGAGTDYYQFDRWNYYSTVDEMGVWATIYDFDKANDIISVVGTPDGVDTFAELSTNFVQDGDNVKISFTDLPSIVIENVEISDLSASNFIFY